MFKTIRTLFVKSAVVVAEPVVEFVAPVVEPESPETVARKLAEFEKAKVAQDKRMAMVWVRVQIDSVKYVRFVRPLAKAIVIVNGLREKGIVCGYDRDFTGKHCSDNETIRKMYAALGRQGITL